MIQRADSGLYEDSAYDAQGYGMSTRIHKRSGVRWHFRPLVDTPITKEEKALVDAENEYWERQWAMEQKCSHQWIAESHEERRCVRCGAVDFVLDL